MSELKTRLSNDVKEAMKNKENFKRDTLRMVMSMIKQVEVDERKELTDDDVIKLLQKAQKQREEAATQYKEGNREDLADKELQEVEIIKAYLPAQLEDAELESALKAIIQNVGAQGSKDMGKVMGAATKELAGKADGKRISAMVKTLLG